MAPRAVFPATGRGPMLHLAATEGRAKLFIVLLHTGLRILEQYQVKHLVNVRREGCSAQRSSERRERQILGAYETAGSRSVRTNSSKAAASR